MTVTKRPRSETRSTVHQLLLNGDRSRDIASTLEISGAALAKHLIQLRADGLIVAPPVLPWEGLLRASGSSVTYPMRVEFWQHRLTGWVTAIEIPKVINPEERGLHGHTDWLMMVVGPGVDNVRSWVHMRGQRISERQVENQLIGTQFAGAAKLIALALGHVTGLDIVVEEPTGATE